MDMEMFEELFFRAFGYLDTPTLIISIVLSLFTAFFSFKFLKLTLIINAAYFGYGFGTVTLGLGLKELVSGFDLSILLGILCAIVFSLIAVKIYKYFIYFFGGYIGFVIGLILTILFFGLEGAGLFIGLALAIVLTVVFAKFFYGKLFKPFYIISTSFSGMLSVAVYAALLISKDLETMAVATLVGFVLGIPATICQFKICKDITIDDVL